MLSFVLLLLLIVLQWTKSGSAIPVAQCHPAHHICEGRCPHLPEGIDLPTGEEHGLCLKESETEACVCWLRNSDQHLQTLFKCEVAANSTVKHVMCLPPPVCFPPDGPGHGCMIVLHCPCTDQGRGEQIGKWRSGVAVILRSKTPVPAPADRGSAEGGGGGVVNPDESREFGVKHLLFLLAFVIAPLLCWCLLTFFHEGRCRRKRPSPESEPMPTDRPEPSQQPRTPTAPKMESPPPYGEIAEPGDRCLLAFDCGPPPSYEEIVRDSE